MHADEIIPTVMTWNIYIGLCLSEAHARIRCQLYEMFKVKLLVSINKHTGLQGTLNFPLPRDSFWYRLARGIPLKEGVL